jgi:hypothetical protein
MVIVANILPMRWLLLASLGSGRTVADSEIAISTTKHMAGTDAAPFLNYLGRLVSPNALVLCGLANFQEVGDSEVILRLSSAVWEICRTLRLVVRIPCSRQLSLPISSDWVYKFAQWLHDVVGANQNREDSSFSVSPPSVVWHCWCRIS